MRRSFYLLVFELLRDIERMLCVLISLVKEAGGSNDHHKRLHSKRSLSDRR